MSFGRWTFLVGTAVLLGIGCGDGASGTGGGGSGGQVTTTSTVSSTSSTSTSSSTSSTSTTSGTGGTVDPSGFSCTGAAPSLANDIVPITTPKCSAQEGCHLAMHTAFGVYDMLVNRIAEQCLDNRLMVNPGDPEHSYVIHKLTNHNICTGQTMPKDAAMLPNDEIQIIYDWICTGAPNN
jgi:hypothetical protein